MTKLTCFLSKVLKDTKKAASFNNEVVKEASLCGPHFVRSFLLPTHNSGYSYNSFSLSKSKQ